MLQDELKAARQEVLDAFNYQTPNGFFQRYLSEFEIAILSMLYRKTASGGVQLSDVAIDAIAKAVAKQLNKPIMVADNTGTNAPFFVATNQPATFRGVSFQVLPNRTTSSDYWVLLFDQTSVVPQGTPLVKAGLIGKGVAEGNGHETEIYQLGVEFKKGIVACISLESDRYVSPPTSELFISVAYHGSPSTTPETTSTVIGMNNGAENYAITLINSSQTYLIAL